MYTISRKNSNATERRQKADRDKRRGPLVFTENAWWVKCQRAVRKEGRHSSAFFTAMVEIQRHDRWVRNGLKGQPPVVALVAPAPTGDFWPNAGFGRLHRPADRAAFVGRKTEDVTKTGAYAKRAGT